MSRFLSILFLSFLYIRYNTAAHVVNSTYIYISTHLYTRPAVIPRIYMIRLLSTL